MSLGVGVSADLGINVGAGLGVDLSLNLTNKLTIVRGTLQGKKAVFNEFDPTSIITVPFNPSEYSVEKSNSFSEESAPGLGSPIIQFTSGGTRTLALELLLDTYAYNDGLTVQASLGPLDLQASLGDVDVRTKYIAKLEQLIEVDGDIHAPPPCKVLWGSLEFVGFLDSLRKSYTLFLNDGTPVRARVNLSFKEFVPVELQVKTNPFASPDKFKRYIIKDGDTIWQLAYEHYGEPGLWRFIADANEKIICDPKELEPGVEILILPLPERVG